jgi:hypothetical protein
MADHTRSDLEAHAHATRAPFAQVAFELRELVALGWSPTSRR